MKKQEAKFWGFVDSSHEPPEKLAINPQFVEMSKSEMFLASCTNILRNLYGFIQSVEQGGAFDKEGNELPLYTYPTIEYLTQFDFSEKRVFEFGSGGSTLFWMRRSKEVISAENHLEWSRKLTHQLNERARIVHAEGPEFPRAISTVDGYFDVIVVDSSGMRFDCAVQALEKLAPGGIIILDNSDWHFNTAAMLKKAGLLQVDMTGFKPSYSHTSTTSIFFHREFDFPIIAERQPIHGIGAKNLHSAEWDKPAS
jgi:hypothetical protein